MITNIKKNSGHSPGPGALGDIKYTDFPSFIGLLVVGVKFLIYVYKEFVTLLDENERLIIKSKTRPRACTEFTVIKVDTATLFNLSEYLRPFSLPRSFRSL